MAFQYQTCRLQRAKQFIAEGKNDEAIALLRESLVCPENLGEGKLYGAQENDFYYYLGVAFRQKGDQAEARRCFEEALLGPTEPATAMYYNDAKPDKIFFSGLAYRALAEMAGNETERERLNGKANGVFYRLITYGEKHIFDTVKMDYFAVSLPDLLIWEGDLQEKNTEHCEYMLALGNLGMGNQEKAERYRNRVLSQNINHQGAMDMDLA